MPASRLLRGLAPFLLLTLLVSAGCQSAAAPTATPAPTAQSAAKSQGGTPVANRYSAPPAMQIDPKKSYSATLHTSLGDITVDFFADEAPKTVNNFVFLAREGYYENVKFHRIIKGFMIQGGDPTGTGAGSPGYRFEDEPIKRRYERGIIAMANAGPNTNGSQFFIMHQNYNLPPNYTIFGRVTDQASLETLDKIANVPVSASPRGEMSVPKQDVFIQSVDVAEK
jgi:cyclophilin family peptidyl-prolyl cis-trans isomerase